MVVENRNLDLSPTCEVRELYTEDTVLALNAALLEHGVETSQIISILTVPGQAMVQAKPSQFRVLYRSNQA